MYLYLVYQAVFQAAWGRGCMYSFHRTVTGMHHELCVGVALKVWVGLFCTARALPFWRAGVMTMASLKFGHQSLSACNIAKVPQRSCHGYPKPVASRQRPIFKRLRLRKHYPATNGHTCYEGRERDDPIGRGQQSYLRLP